MESGGRNDNHYQHKGWLCIEHWLRNVSCKSRKGRGLRSRQWTENNFKDRTSRGEREQHTVEETTSDGDYGVRRVRARQRVTVDENRKGQRTRAQTNRNPRTMCERAATANGTRAAAAATVVGTTTADGVRAADVGWLPIVPTSTVYTHLRSRSMEERHAASESQARHNWSDDGVNKKYGTLRPKRRPAERQRRVN